MDASARLNPVTLPVLTLLLCGAAAVVFVAPALQMAFIYDRAAIAGGEWWRLVTCNFVHHSSTHFAYDVVAFFIAGTLIELRRYRNFWLVCLIAGTTIGAVLYVTTPEMDYYGGLSGIVTAAVVYLCLQGLTEAGPWRALCGLALTIVIAKIGSECAFETSLLTYAEPQLFRPTPMSHVVGAAAALLLFLSTRLTSLLRR